MSKPLRSMTGNSFEERLSRRELKVDGLLAPSTHD
jgi:hypothetical protein